MVLTDSNSESSELNVVKNSLAVKISEDGFSNEYLSPATIIMLQSSFKGPSIQRLDINFQKNFKDKQKSLSFHLEPQDLEFYFSQRMGSDARTYCMNYR